MYTEDRLRKISQDRKPKERRATIGELLKKRVSHLKKSRAGKWVRIDQIVQKKMPGLFKEHCRILAYHNQKLTVGVDDPGLVDVLRRQYLFELRSQINQALPEIIIQDIQFLSAKK